MTRYDKQRPHRTPPHVSLGVLRVAMGLTLDQVCERVSEEFPELRVTRGHLSAIENGHRGASAQLLNALALAYGIEPTKITTDYAPRETAGAA